MTEHSVADTLDRAADYIEEHGLCRDRKGGLGADGSVCVIQAINKANPHSYLVRSRAIDAMRELTGEDLLNVWSDYLAADATDVINHLRKAAEAARAEVSA
jgi:hypothetical protein